MPTVADSVPIAALARILVRVAQSGNPVVQSVDTLADAAGMSRRTFQYRCQAAGVAARDCVRFVQCL